MIVTKEGERLFLRATAYNLARVLSKVAEMVVARGGRVKKLYSAIVSNSTIDDAIREITGNISRINAAIAEHGENDARKFALISYQADLDRWSSVDNSPITVTHTSYISFVLDDVYYYYQFDDNPFFPFYYKKTPVVDGQYSRDASLDEDKKTWFYDQFFGNTCSANDIHAGAAAILDMLTGAGNTPNIRDVCRERVPNTYSVGYHMETIVDPERFAKIDF